MLVFSIILLTLALATFAVSVYLKTGEERRVLNKEKGEYEYVFVKNEFPNKIIRWVSIGLGSLSALFLVLGSFYTQDVGTAVVERDITGNVVGKSTTSGLHWKAPWVVPVEWNIRNQNVSMLTPQNDAENGAGYEADGPQITVQDKDGVSSNVDISLRYSIKPDAVEAIYRSYKDEETFKQAMVYQEIRAVVREVPNEFTTLELLTQRGEVEAAIQKALEKRWKGTGVMVDSVSLQEIRPPEVVQKSYADAQQALINVTKEQSKLEAAEVSAQQKVVQAQADADANRLLQESLTDSILKQRYLDTLKELAASGNVVVVPEGFNGLVNVR